MKTFLTQTIVSNPHLIVAITIFAFNIGSTWHLDVTQLECDYVGVTRLLNLHTCAIRACISFAHPTMDPYGQSPRMVSSTYQIKKPKPLLHCDKT